MKKILTEAEIEQVLGGRDEHQTDDNDGALALREFRTDLPFGDITAIKSLPNFAAIDGVGIRIGSVACDAYSILA